MIVVETLPAALLTWANGVIPELNGSYDYIPASKPEALPDIICEVARTRVQMGGGDEFPMWNIQQQAVEVYECSLAIMVDNADPQAAAAQLRRFRDLLAAAALTDETLAGEVPFRSPLISFDFTPPFVEYEDGTKGREMTMTLTVGDFVEAE